MRPCPKLGCRNLDPACRKKGQYITDTLPEPFAIITYLKDWPGSEGHCNMRSVSSRIFHRNYSLVITVRPSIRLPFKDVMVLKCPSNDCLLYWQCGHFGQMSDREVADGLENEELTSRPGAKTVRLRVDLAPSGLVDLASGMLQNSRRGPDL